MGRSFWRVPDVVRSGHRLCHEAVFSVHWHALAELRAQAEERRCQNFDQENWFVFVAENGLEASPRFEDRQALKPMIACDANELKLVHFSGAGVQF